MRVSTITGSADACGDAAECSDRLPLFATIPGPPQAKLSAAEVVAELAPALNQLAQTEDGMRPVYAAPMVFEDCTPGIFFEAFFADGWSGSRWTGMEHQRAGHMNARDTAWEAGPHGGRA